MNLTFGPKAQMTAVSAPLLVQIMQFCAIVIFMAAFHLSLSLTVNAATEAETGSKAQDQTQTAIFAGGCFWCTESDFEKVKGVISATSGYTGGNKQNPSYRQVSSGGTKHTEAVRVEFDPKVVSYETLLKVFWHSIDPLAKDRQFCDKGRQYRSGIFYLDKIQQQLAEVSKIKAQAFLEKNGELSGPIHTEITQASAFWSAEDYHQDYYKKNPIRYKWYRTGCGRDDRLKAIWGDMANWHPSK